MMDLSLFFLHRQGLAGQPCSQGRPDLPFAGSKSALGSLPSVALSSAGANVRLVRRVQVSLKESVSRFRFPGGL
jgi:hypothetical protein